MSSANSISNFLLFDLATAEGRKEYLISMPGGTL